jgi:hypothetical protein
MANKTIEPIEFNATDSESEEDVSSGLGSEPINQSKPNNPLIR